MIRKTYEEINLDNLEYNVSKIIELSSDYKYHIGVVKASCYGLGLECINAIVNAGANYLAVSSLEEALKVRKMTDTPILVLEPININYIKVANDNNITLTISSVDYLEKVRNMTFKAHIKINTGMNRLGISNNEDLNKAYNIIMNSNIYLEGIYTHIYNTISNIDTNRQFDMFKVITRDIDLSKIDIVHIPNSETIFNYSKLNFVNGCRMGIIMYGLTDTIELKSVFSLKSKIIEIHEVKKGDTVGYNGAFKASNDTFIGIVPIGYADGIIRSNTGRYLYINNKKYNIVGNICMDMLFVEIDNTIKINDEVLIIKDNNHINYIADYTNTINYEVMCLISNRVKREYLICKK